MIEITDGQDVKQTVVTVASGGSETTFKGKETNPRPNQIFVLPSRRTFAPFFGKSENARSDYIEQQQRLQDTRGGQSDFSQRIFHINNKPEKRIAFEADLEKVLYPVPDWTIEQSEQGQYYLKYTNQGQSHSSDGLGEGLVSTFFIVDALYDSEPGTMIVIDEPELSLHPQLQARVRDYLVEKSADRQIVISTHSPKFIDWWAISAGAKIARTAITQNGVTLYELSDTTRDRIISFLSDMNNPHVLGSDANEVFFLDDKVVLVEGQEDILYLPRALSDLKIELNGSFYGWGVGGADKMSIIASILKDLGFSKVAGILDNDKRSTVAPLQSEYPDFHFVAQPADDVRNNPARQKPDKTTLLTTGNKSVAPEFRDETEKVFHEINDYFRSSS